MTIKIVYPGGSIGYHPDSVQHLIKPFYPLPVRLQDLPPPSLQVLSWNNTEAINAAKYLDLRFDLW